MSNLQRQLVDIQHQAEKLYRGSPSVTDIDNFARYSQEIKQYLLANISMLEARQLVSEIPDIEEFSIRANDGLLFFLIPGALWTWYKEREYIDHAKQVAQIAAGKFSSVEFLVRNYFEE